MLKAHEIEVSLIARLAAATVGSRDLDAAIHGVPPEAVDHWENLVPHYTASLDAALTLLPSHISYELTFSAAGDRALRRCHLWDWRRSPPAFDPGNKWTSEGHQPLPLHVCIAALREREARND